MVWQLLPLGPHSPQLRTRCPIVSLGIHAVVSWGRCCSCHWVRGPGSFSFWGKKLCISLSLRSSLLYILSRYFWALGVPHSPRFGDTSSVVFPTSPQERSSSPPLSVSWPGAPGPHSVFPAHSLVSLLFWFLEMLIFLRKVLTFNFCILSVIVTCLDLGGLKAGIYSTTVLASPIITTLFDSPPNLWYHEAHRVYSWKLGMPRLEEVLKLSSLRLLISQKKLRPSALLGATHFVSSRARKVNLTLQPGSLNTCLWTWFLTYARMLSSVWASLTV